MQMKSEVAFNHGGKEPSIKRRNNLVHYFQSPFKCFAQKQREKKIAVRMGWVIIVLYVHFVVDQSKITDQLLLLRLFLASRTLDKIYFFFFTRSTFIIFVYRKSLVMIKYFFIQMTDIKYICTTLDIILSGQMCRCLKSYWQSINQYINE